jgi:arylsulfatase A-like enzyme
MNADATTRPNILLIMTDQQRGDCLSAAGHPVLITPNMDAIGGHGVRFTQAYATCPSCIPARRSLLSGQYPRTHGLVGYQEGLEWNPPATLPGVLRSAGYQTVLVERSMHQHPFRKRFGYDEMIIHSHRDASSDYSRFLIQNGLTGPDPWHSAGVMHNDWTARPFSFEERFHHTTWVTDEALRFLERRDPSCPFFLTVSYLAPHPPLQPPAFYFERYLRTGVPPPTIGDWACPPASGGIGDDVSANSIHLEGERLQCMRAGYYGLINHVDDQIRRLLNPIIGIPRLAPNTVVVFTSDHGEMLGDHYLFRKQLPYEPAARIPLMIWDPRHKKSRGRTVSEAVALEDVMPTLLDLVGLPIPPSVEGRSLAPWIRGETPAWDRGWLLLEHAPTFLALTDGREKYLWFAQSGREQFFDLTRDPGERHDAIADPEYAERVALWRERLVRELADRPEGFSDGRRLIPGRPYRASRS